MHNHIYAQSYTHIHTHVQACTNISTNTQPHNLTYTHRCAYIQIISS